MPVIIHDLRARVRGIQSGVLAVQDNIQRALSADNIPAAARNEIVAAERMMGLARLRLERALEHVPMYEELEND